MRPLSEKFMHVAWIKYILYNAGGNKYDFIMQEIRKTILTISIEGHFDQFRLTLIDD